MNIIDNDMQHIRKKGGLMNTEFTQEKIDKVRKLIQSNLCRYYADVDCVRCVTRCPYDAALAGLKQEQASLNTLKKRVRR